MQRPYGFVTHPRRRTRLAGLLFSFFDGMFPPLDDVPQVDDPRPQVPAEAAQSTNCPPNREASDGSGVPPPEIDEEQIDFGS